MSSKYHRTIARNEEGKSDVYDVLRAFEVTDPAVAHAIKKLLAPGQRSGGKSYMKDLEEARWSVDCAIKALGPKPKLEVDRTPMPDMTGKTVWTLTPGGEYETKAYGRGLKLWVESGNWFGTVGLLPPIDLGNDQRTAMDSLIRAAERAS